MDTTNIEGIVISPLKIIENPKGNIYHALKKSEPVFSNFGEAYFSIINLNEIKGWKKHNEMVLNLIVPVGKIKFVVYDDRIESKTRNQFFQIIVSVDNYKRVTVNPGLWLAFQGLDKQNLLLNIASIEHDPCESENISIESVKYNWKTNN